MGDAVGTGDVLALLDRLPDVLYVLRIEPERRFEFVSGSVEDLVGFTPDEHYADPDLGVRLVDPRDVATLAQLASAPEEQVCEAMLRWRTRGGESVWTHHRCVKHRRADGSVVLVGSARAVDAQVHAREELTAAEEELRLLAENAADIVLRLDADGRIGWVSPSVQRLLGYEPAALLARSGIEFVHEADAPRVRALTSSLRSGTRLGGSERVRLLRRDGTYGWWDATARRTSDDPLSCDLVVALRDVEAEEHARASAASEAERRSAAVASMLDPHLLVHAVVSASGRTRDFTIVDANQAACRMARRPLAELLGSPMSEVLARIGAPALLDACVAAVTSGQPLVLDDVCLDPGSDGPRYDVRGVRLAQDSLSLTLRDVTERHRLVSALAESEARYRVLAEHSGDTVVSTDPSGNLTYVSPAVTQLLGWDPSELIGSHMTTLLHPEDLESGARTVARVRESTDHLGSGRVRLRRRDGSAVWVSGVAHGIVDGSGTLTAVVSTWRDVQAEVEAQEAADSERARLAAVLDSELEPHVYLEAVRDDDGRIADFVYRDVNRAACEYMSLPRDEFEGRRVLELLPGQAASGMMAMYVAAVESGEPLVLNDYAYPHETLGAERRYDIRAVKVGDGLSFAWRDVTERFKAASALAESREQYRILAENVNDVVFRTDADYVVTYASDGVTRLLGWTPAERIGLHAFDFIHPDDRQSVRDRSPDPGTGVLGPVRFRARTVSGEYRWVEATLRALRDESGAVVGHVGGYHDVTADVAAQRELERQAHTDSLTGLLNRGEVTARLESMLTHPPRSGGHIAVLYCDLDGLKRVNDSHGHAAGDLLLTTTSRRIRSCIRETDLVARIGGDEMLVVLADVGGLDDAATVAAHISRTVAEPIDTDGDTISSTISVGVAVAEPGEAIENLIARADTNMYAAKTSGGDAAATGYVPA